MTEEESEKSYRSGLPGFLGVIDTAISKTISDTGDGVWLWR